MKKQTTQTRDQLSLFEQKRTNPKPITYGSLTIHQKINYRANKCGFEIIPYLSKFNYYRQPLHKPITDTLSKDYWKHYELNAGAMNCLDSYIKEKTTPTLITDLFT